MASGGDQGGETVSLATRTCTCGPILGSVRVRDLGVSEIRGP